MIHCYFNRCYLKWLRRWFKFFWIIYTVALERSDDQSDDENDDEEVPEQTGTSGEQCPGMQTFRTLGFELADISKSILLAEAPVMNRIASVEECHRLLKVSTFVM